MDVGFVVVGNVVINHMADTLNVEATSGNIGGDNNIEHTFFEFVNGLFAQGLVEVSVQSRSGIASGLKFFGQIYRRRLGAHKHNDAVKVLNFENTGQGIEFLVAVDDQISLRNFLNSAGFIGNTHHCGIANISIGNSANGRGHGG